MGGLMDFIFNGPERPPALPPPVVVPPTPAAAAAKEDLPRETPAPLPTSLDPAVIEARRQERQRALTQRERVFALPAASAAATFASGAVTFDKKKKLFGG